jgi:succinate-semialdehyde dehydrogenase / glutarate-semialdehyde dehydrogenase
MSGKPRNATGEAANGATIQTINPASHEPGKTYRLHTLDEARSIAVHCAAAQKLWRRTPLAERSKLMYAAARIMRANKSRYAALMTEEMGKTVTEGQAEIEKCAATAEYFAENAGAFLSARPQKLASAAAGAAPPKAFVTFQSARCRARSDAMELSLLAGHALLCAASDGG